MSGRVFFKMGERKGKRKRETEGREKDECVCVSACACVCVLHDFQKLQYELEERC